MGSGRDHLPATPEEVRARGWREVDVVLVTGDAFVDHPSFGAAAVARALESEGFRTAVLPRPDWKDPAAFRRFGRPRLFFGVTGGNLDSLVANRNAWKARRPQDDYAPGGIPGGRPDRACIVYAQACRAAYPDVPVILGGIEASLRRLSHYDWWSDKVRRSLLLDARADLLVYGMGEASVLEAARRLAGGKDLEGIRGTARVFPVADRPQGQGVRELPSFEEVRDDAMAFLDAQRIFEDESRADGAILVQEGGAPGRVVVVEPPRPPETQADLDRWYDLPFTREVHPVHREEGPVPALEVVKDSVTAHRGCLGDCSFCALTLHQGRWIVSRSPESIEREIRKIVSAPDSRGRISDVGGPSANMYGLSCPNLEKGEPCLYKACLPGEPCPSLRPGGSKAWVDLLERIARIPGVKSVGIGSGPRFDLLDKESLKRICARFVRGQLKVAPEHCGDQTLMAMRKPSWSWYVAFESRFKSIVRRLGKEIYLSNYFLVAHPGTDLKEAVELFRELRKRNYSPEQVQVFIPLPMTRSAAMYHTGMDLDWSTVYVPRGDHERRLHLALAQWKDPRNRRYVLEALEKTGRMDLARRLDPHFRKRPGGQWK